mmetsp:Transcript_41801/g.81986  ORF Transcript_41801/g.81986 Transcript_41801/m.81986 type:complete len:192 (-) Transcript_41801:731-1306(-)
MLLCCNFNVLTKVIQVVWMTLLIFTGFRDSDLRRQPNLGTSENNFQYVICLAWLLDLKLALHTTGHCFSSTSNGLAMFGHEGPESPAAESALFLLREHTAKPPSLLMRVLDGFRPDVTVLPFHSQRFPAHQFRLVCDGGTFDVGPVSRFEQEQEAGDDAGFVLYDPPVVALDVAHGSPVFVDHLDGFAGRI